MEEHSRLEFHEQRDFSGIFGALFAFIRQNLGPLLTSLLLICGPLILLEVVFSVLFQLHLEEFDVESYMGGVSDPSSMVQQMTALYGQMFLGNPWGVLAMLFSTVIVHLVLWVTTEYVMIYIRRGTPISVQDVMAALREDFWLLLGTSIVLFIINTLGTLLGLVSCCILFIPYFYILPPLSLVVFIRLDQRNLGLFESIQEAFALIKRNWWITFGELVVVTLIIVAVYLVFNIPAFLYGAMQEMLAYSETGIPVLSSIVTLISSFSFFLYAFFAIAVGLIYFSLHEQRGAGGLMDRIDSIGDGDLDE